MSTNRVIRILEETYSDKPQADRDAGVIRGVKILGRESKNGRTYSESAMTQAAKMYEGLGVNFDHRERDQKSRDRKFAEGAGWLESVTVKADGVYGDLHVFKSNPSSGMLFETAERRPERFGLSHDADGRTKQVSGKTVVESIENVFSVDIVQNPATNRGLFESVESKTVATKPIKEFVESIDAKCEGRATLLKLLEMDMVPADTSVDMPPDEAPAPSADDQVKDAFRAMVIAAFDDDKLDSKATLAKIKEILAAQEKLTAKPEPKSEPKAEDKPADEKPKEDAMPTKESIEAERKAREATATEILEAAGIKADPKDAASFNAKVHALAALTETTERKALVESWKPVATKPGVAKPSMSRPLTESSTLNPATITDAKSFATAILNS